MNTVTKWSKCQRVGYVILSILMPPFAILYRLRERSKKFANLNYTVLFNKLGFWKNLRMR